MNDWAENYNVYIGAQAGFRKGIGTTDNIFILYGLISHCINNNGKLLRYLSTFKKHLLSIFDYIVHDILWFKLVEMGVHGKLLNVIKSIYSNLKSRVKFDNRVSSDFTCCFGVRQGECLSPILFSMYLNNIVREYILKGAEGIDIGMLKLFLLLHADDVILFANDKDN